MSASKCIKPLDGLRHFDGGSMMRSASGRWWRGPLVACLLLVGAIATGSSRPAHALQATWTGNVETFVLDSTCPGGFSCVDRKTSSDSPVVDLSVSTFRINNLTYFALASVTSFINVGDALLVQGVAQSDALRTPEFSGCCTVGGEATFSLTFDATTVPLAIDLFGTAHRIGPNWGFLTSPGGIEISGFPSGLFVQLPAPQGKGTLPSNTMPSWLQTAESIACSC